jgi:hypothetical protein
MIDAEFMIFQEPLQGVLRGVFDFIPVDSGVLECYI